MDAPSAAPALASGRKRVALRVACGVYLAFVAAVVFWPTPVDRPAAGTLAQMFIWLHRHGVPYWFGYNLFEWLANVAFFVPFGAFAVLLRPRDGWAGRIGWAVGLACGVSSAVELTQWLLLPQRTGSVADVLANTCGALVGAAATTLWTRRPRRAP